MTPPQKPLGMSDFFALEAGEYLERLDGLLVKDDGSSGDEIVRLARALRGSALMANQQAIARVAAGLETLWRAVREGRRTWDAQTRQLAVRSVDDLKIFVRQAGSWTDAHTAKAEALAQELEQLAGRPSAQIRAAEALGLDAGARAFVAREGAAIASALDRAAQALRANPLAHDPLQHVLRALQPLRGLAALADLPPLPDLLDGIERTVAERELPGSKPPAGLGELFQSAATAIARAAREVAEQGRPNPDAPEFQRFGALAVRAMDGEPDAVPIASLYHDDAGPHVVQRGVAAARPATLGRLELVSHGEHLRQAADSLERAPSATQRELRAHTLAGTSPAHPGSSLPSSRRTSSARGPPITAWSPRAWVPRRSTSCSGRHRSTPRVRPPSHLNPGSPYRRASCPWWTSGRCCIAASVPWHAPRSCGDRRSRRRATRSAPSSTKSAISWPSPSTLRLLAPRPPSGRVAPRLGEGWWGTWGAWVVGLAVTGLLLAWALHGVDPRAVLEQLRHADPLLFGAAMALATATFPLRALRWRLILRDAGGEAFPLRPLWHATAVGFMANNVLPARAGEVARAYLARRQLPVRFTTALASIGVERVFDGLGMVALLAIAIAASSFP